MIEPFLRWAGSKRWFAKEFGDALKEQLNGGTYIEPFLGGGAMALHLQPTKAILADINGELINTWIALKLKTEEVISLLDELRDSTDEETYYAVRDMKPTEWSDKAARFLYLNRLGFNGLYRENRSGEFNVPYGKKEKVLHDPDHLREIGKILQRPAMCIRCAPFTETIPLAKEGDLVYADPPYDGTGFTGYDKSGFGDDEQLELARLLYEAAERGASIVAHNADTERVRELYAWAEITEMPEKRSINAKGEGRGAVPCVLITT